MGGAGAKTIAPGKSSAGFDQIERYRDVILKGAKPMDVPVMQATRFGL
jgi:hypothetical protein